MILTAKMVVGVNRCSIPDENETIEDDFDLKQLKPLIENLVVYTRDKLDCPFGRGNWLINLYLKDNSIYAIKLPKEMSQEHIKKYIQPLLNFLKREKI